MVRSATSQNATDGEPGLEKAQRPEDAREEQQSRNPNLNVASTVSTFQPRISNPRHFQSEALPIIY